MTFRATRDIAAICHDLPRLDEAAAQAARARQAVLTKPPGSLGRLEDLAIWLASWQGHDPPSLDHAAIVIFAGNHGVAERGVSAYPAAVTAQMVANFAAGGAAINQLARQANAELRVVPITLDRPTRDFTLEPAMPMAEFLAAVDIGFAAVPPRCDLLVVGEMGIANTTAAAALCAALLGGGAERWVGPGTGVDAAGLERKRSVIDAALARHRDSLADPLAIAAALGGRETAAILGAVLAARLRRVPTLLDGFVASSAVLALMRLNPSTLAHCQAGHVSAEVGHRQLLAAMGLKPLLDLDMRLGEGSGAAVAINILRAAVACHAGMATFAGAGVAGPLE